MCILISVWSDVGEVGRLIVGDIGCELGVGDAIFFLTRSRADVGEVDKRIVTAVVGVGGSTFQPLVSSVGMFC